MDLRGTLALLGTVLCWGTIPVLLRSLTEHVDPWTANGLRYPLAAILYWPVLALAWRRGRLDRRLLRRALVPAAFALLGQIFWAMAPYFLEASLIAFLVKSSMVWGLAGALILFPDERPLLKAPRFHAGLLLVVLGFIALTVTRIMDGQPDTPAAPVSHVGILIVLACSVFFGLYGVSVRYFLQGVNPLLAFGVVAQYSTLGTVTLMFLLGTPAIVTDLSLNGWALIAGSSILGIGISHTLYYTAIARLGASIASVGELLGPFVTLALAHVVLGESLSPPEYAAGMTMVLGGGLLVAARKSAPGSRRE